MLFYRFCRTIDDIADRSGLTDGERWEQLSTWLEAVQSGLPPVLEDVVTRHAIDRTLLVEIIKGCASDIATQRFQSFADLEQYCWRVAAAVGLVSIKIFGCRDPESETYAIHLGHALQLTNILRDIREDALQGRIYLPLDDLARFGIEESEIFNLQPSQAFTALLRHQAGRARARFAAAIPPRVDFKPLLPARIMSAVYQRILDRMERENFPVLHKRIKLSTREKVACLIGTWLRG
jgi:phytoene synthase